MTYEEAAEAVRELAWRLSQTLSPEDQYKFWIRVEGDACSGQGDARNAVLEQKQEPATCPACKSWPRGNRPVCTYCGDGQAQCPKCGGVVVARNGCILGGRLGCTCKKSICRVCNGSGETCSKDCEWGTCEWCLGTGKDPR